MCRANATICAAGGVVSAVAKTPVGPIVRRECGYCERRGHVPSGQGDAECTVCTNCDGSGYVDVAVQPFVTLEAAMEQIQAIRTCMRLRRTETFRPEIGTAAYHVDAAEDYIASLFQQLVVMLPDEYERTEGV
jgi:DnaJ-class molecular chaperone